MPESDIIIFDSGRFGGIMNNILNETLDHLDKIKYLMEKKSNDIMGWTMIEVDRAMSVIETYKLLEEM